MIKTDKTGALKYILEKKIGFTCKKIRECATAKGIGVNTRIEGSKAFFRAGEHFDQGNR